MEQIHSQSVNYLDGSLYVQMCCVLFHPSPSTNTDTPRFFFSSIENERRKSRRKEKEKEKRNTSSYEAKKGKGDKSGAPRKRGQSVRDAT